MIISIIIIEKKVLINMFYSRLYSRISIYLYRDDELLRILFSLCSGEKRFKCRKREKSNEIKRVNSSKYKNIKKKKETNKLFKNKKEMRKKKMYIYINK
jgi:hypothetical protein